MSHRFDTEPERDVSFAFAADRTVDAVSIWAGGFYFFAQAASTFSPGAVALGTANSPYGAHVLIVLGAVSVDEITLTITGTSIRHDGTRTGGDTDTITIPNATPANTYFQTTKRFIGQVTIQTTAGTAKSCNYGFAFAWQNHRRDFLLRDIEIGWTGAVNDAGADLIVRHHTATGWTYNAAAAPTPPTPVFRLTTVYGAESDIKAQEAGAVRRTALNLAIDASGIEGLIFEHVQSVMGGIAIGTVVYTIVGGPPA